MTSEARRQIQRPSGAYAAPTLSVAYIAPLTSSPLQRSRLSIPGLAPFPALGDAFLSCEEAPIRAAGLEATDSL